tara:strand:- start:410 stop:1234 length:825 start_codon:yes stop_codon:yes gene_type:complete
MIENCYELDKVINFIKLFNGIVYGEYISNYYINNLLCNNKQNSDFTTINIIFHNKIDLIYFIRILYINFEIYNNNDKDFIIILKSIIDNKYYRKIYKLNILNINEYFLYNNNIDINLISLNKNSLILLKHYNKNNVSNFDITFKRIINKKFAFIYEEYNIKNLIKNIEESINLIKNNWIMDDFNLGNNSIVILYWKNIFKNNFRCNLDEKEYDKIKLYDSCCICSCPFKDNDIIINTKCHHNFHWNCNKDLSGLEHWITNFSDNCPVCRTKQCI